MSIAELISLLENRLATLNNSKATAVALGDLGQLNVLDAEIQQTTSTLVQLRTLAVL